MVVSSLTVFFLMLLGLIAGIFSGYYLFAVLGGLGVIFGYVFWGPDVFNLVFLNFFGTVKNYTLPSMVPGVKPCNHSTNSFQPVPL